MNRLNIELEDLNYDMEEEFKTLRTNLMFCGVDKKSYFDYKHVSGRREDRKVSISFGSIGEDE